MMDIPPRGTCVVCGRKYATLRDGRVAMHGSGKKNVWPPQRCDGWGELAVEVVEQREREEESGR